MMLAQAVFQFTAVEVITLTATVVAVVLGVFAIFAIWMTLHMYRLATEMLELTKQAVGGRRGQAAPAAPAEPVPPDAAPHAPAETTGSPQADPSNAMDRLWALRITPEDDAARQEKVDRRMQEVLSGLERRLEQAVDEAQAKGRKPSSLREEARDLLRQAVAETKAVGAEAERERAQGELRRNVLAYLLALNMPRSLEDVMLAMATGSPFRVTVEGLSAALKGLKEGGLIRSDGMDDRRSLIMINPERQAEARGIAFGGEGRV